MTEELYSLREASQETGVPLSTLQQAVSNNLVQTTLKSLPGNRMRLRHFVTREEMERFAKLYHDDAEKLRTPIVQSTGPKNLGYTDDMRMAADVRRELEMRREAREAGCSTEDLL